MANRNTLTASNIRYLLVMKELDKDGNGIRCIDIASALSLTKPSVHNMMSTFRDMGLVSKGAYGVVFFTDTGNKIVLKYRRYYDAVSNLLKCSFPYMNDVRKATCYLLSEISEESLEDLSQRQEATDRNKK